MEDIVVTKLTELLSKPEFAQELVLNALQSEEVRENISDIIQDSMEGQGVVVVVEKKLVSAVSPKHVVIGGLAVVGVASTLYTRYKLLKEFKLV